MADEKQESRLKEGIYFMKILKISVIAFAVFVFLGSIALTLFAIGDDKGPTIVCSESGMIQATIDVTDEELLSYVTASDERDGDLTSEIKVTRKKFFIANKTTTVVYSVCDSDNNVTQIEKMLYFADYTSPKIYLKNDFYFPAGAVFELSRYVTAEDVLDGDITDSVKVISTDYTSAKGTFSVNIKVSNSMADTTELNVEAYVTDVDYSQCRIVLNEYTAYLPVGGTFDYAANIKTVTNKDNNDYKIADVIIDSSEVDTSKPGVYNVFYQINGKDATVDDEPVSMSRAIVVVREG